MTSVRTFLVLWLMGVAPAMAVPPPGTDFVLPSGQRVPGAPLAETRALAAQAARVSAAVRQVFHVEIGAIPIHVVTLEKIKVLHDEIGGRLRPGWQLHGFELDGHVFVRRELGGVSDEVLVHECLHALSTRFADDAQRHGLSRYVEGVTQFLTLRALAARPNASSFRAERNHTYVASTDFAEALSTLVGDEVLRAAYFGSGSALLAVRVDLLRRNTNVLVRSARLLDRGNEQAAMMMLTGTR